VPRRFAPRMADSHGPFTHTTVPHCGQWYSTRAPACVGQNSMNARSAGSWNFVCASREGRAPMRILIAPPVEFR
jgi:hypothetical protein